MPNDVKQLFSTGRDDQQENVSSDEPSKKCVDDQPLTLAIEALLFSSDKPLSLDNLYILLEEDFNPTRTDIKKALTLLSNIYKQRAIELADLGGSFRFQTRSTDRKSVV